MTGNPKGRPGGASVDTVVTTTGVSPSVSCATQDSATTIDSPTGTTVPRPSEREVVEDPSSRRRKSYPHPNVERWVDTTSLLYLV